MMYSFSLFVFFLCSSFVDASTESTEPQKGLHLADPDGEMCFGPNSECCVKFQPGPPPKLESTCQIVPPPPPPPLSDWLLAVVIEEDAFKPAGLDLYSFTTPDITASEAISTGQNYGVGMSTLTLTTASVFRLQCVNWETDEEYNVYIRGLQPADVQNAFRPTGLVTDTSSLECNANEDFSGAGATGSDCLPADRDSTVIESCPDGWAMTYWKTFPSGNWALYQCAGGNPALTTTVRHCGGSSETQSSKAQVWVKQAPA